MSAVTVERTVVEDLFTDPAPTPARHLSPASALPRADAPGPAVRVVPMPAPAVPLPPRERAATRVPTRLEERVRVLRAHDRSPVLDSADEDRGPVPLADPSAVAGALAHACVEVLLGRRSAAQIARWVTPGVFDVLRCRAAATARVLGGVGSGRATTVRRVRLCPIEPHQVEVSAVVDDGTRVRAVAMRLETHRGVWRATSLEIG